MAVKRKYGVGRNGKRMSPAQLRALKKAQAASARKRRGKGKGKLAKANRRSRRSSRIAIGTGIVAGAAVGLAGYKTNRIRKDLNRAFYPGKPKGMSLRKYKKTI